MAIIEARGLARTFTSAGQYLTGIMLEGVLVAIGLAALCLWIAGRAFIRENA